MNEQIETYMEYLFSLALQKCGNVADAEDLTQDVLLAAYAALGEGKRIDNVRSWLSGTLNHKYYDMLRRKYKMPTVCMDRIPEPPVYEEEPVDRPTAEQVRREVAYLSGRYREVIVRHYLLGEKVDKIAKELNIPKGTVLSRLSTGREQMRKGMEHMEQYEKQSHTPERLEITCHGCPGFKDEPLSLTAGDRMKQNILIVAYEKPVTEVEIARALGIPTPYIEQAVDDLVRSELMSRVGGRVFTNFLILRLEDMLKNLDWEIGFAEQNYRPIWDIFQTALLELGELCWVKAKTGRKRDMLAYYYLLHIFSTGMYEALARVIPVGETYPLRPDGGSWIAEGRRYPQEFDLDSSKIGKYSYAGERTTRWNYMSSLSIELHVYDTQPDRNKWEHGPVELHDDNLCKLLYFMYKGIPFELSGFNPMFLEDIPHLADCGILKIRDGKPEVAIPVISKAEYEEMDKLREKHMRIYADWMEELLRRALPELKIEIPKHLKGRIAGFRQYPLWGLPMAVIKKAIADGDFLKGGKEPVPPMVLAIQEDCGVVR